MRGLISKGVVVCVLALLSTNLYASQQAVNDRHFFAQIHWQIKQKILELREARAERRALIAERRSSQAPVAVPELSGMSATVALAFSVAGLVLVGERRRGRSDRNEQGFEVA